MTCRKKEYCKTIIFALRLRLNYKLRRVLPAFRRNDMKKNKYVILSIIVILIIQLINRSPNLFVPLLYVEIKTNRTLTSIIHNISFFAMILIPFFRFLLSYLVAKMIIKNPKLSALKGYIQKNNLNKLFLKASIFLDCILMLFYFFTDDGSYVVPTIRNFSDCLAEIEWVMVIMLFVSTTLTYLPFYFTIRKASKSS